MVVFSSLSAAIRAGFRWYCFARDERLHIVEMDRLGGGNRRVKSLAFARPTPQELEAMGLSSGDPRALA